MAQYRLTKQRRRGDCYVGCDECPRQDLSILLGNGPVLMFRQTLWDMLAKSVVHQLIKETGSNADLIMDGILMGGDHRCVDSSKLGGTGLLQRLLVRRSRTSWHATNADLP